MKAFCNIIATILLYNLFLFLSIWVLTFYFAWELLLMIFFIDLVPNIILLLMYSSENAREIEIENTLVPFVIPPLLNIVFIFIIAGLSIFLFVFEGIIYFEVEVITAMQTMKIISSIFVISSILLLITYFYQIISTLFPQFGTRTRRNNILSGAYILFRFTFILFFILWANGINLYDPIFVLFGIEFYWFYLAIAISLLLFICGTILFSIGERRRKKIELEFLKDRTRILSELEDSIDLENINETKTKLNNILESLDTQKNYLQKITDVSLQNLTNPSIIDVIEKVVLEKQDGEEKLEDEVEKAISSMNNNTLEHIDFIDKLIQNINFCINSPQETDCFIFKNQISTNLSNIKQAYKQIETRKIVGFKWTATFAIFWTVTSSLLNVSLSTILEGLVSSVL